MFSKELDLSEPINYYSPNEADQIRSGAEWHVQDHTGLDVARLSYHEDLQDSAQKKSSMAINNSQTVTLLTAKPHVISMQFCSSKYASMISVGQEFKM